MKTRLAILIALSGGIFTVPVTFSQTAYIWTGGINGTNTGTDISQPNNWGGIAPNPDTGDTGEWNGTVPGNLSLVDNNSITFGGGVGSSGLNFYLDSAQTGSISIGTDLTIQPGLAIHNLTIDAGAGAFTFGGRDSQHIVNWVARPAGAVHALINNSTNIATLTPWIRFTAGGGSSWQLDFSGTGNWECDSYLVDDNGPVQSIEVDGPGTMIWNPVGLLGFGGLASPININAGTLILLGSHPRLNTQAITLNGNFIFAPTNASTLQTLSGVISGTGTNRVNSGTLILSGQSTYTGDTILAGGELVANGAETPGISGPLGRGTIQFLGGILGFGASNVFDYSSRFSTAAGQAYNIDTAAQNVAFTNAGGLAGNGNTLTKLGAGTLILAGPSTYTGQTTVNAGKLVFQGTKTGAGNITVADGATLGVTATGSQLSPAELTLGSTAGATLEFNNVNSTTTAPIAAGTLSSSGVITIDINSGTFAAGQSYPLLTWANGSPPAVSVGILNRIAGNLSFSGNTLLLNVTAVQPPAPTLNNKLTFVGANIVLTATNNTGNSSTYSLLATDNLTAPISTWPVVRTGTFDSSGSISITNPIRTNQQFFILRVP